MKTSLLLWRSVLALGMVGMTSCLIVPKSDDASIAVHPVKAVQLDATDGISAFEETVYQFGRQNCVHCHTVTAPAFAVSDLKSAYAAAKDPQYVNFSSPGTSQIVKYAGNGHCGESGCANNSSVMADLVAAWASVELAAPAPGSGGTPAPTNPTTGGGATGNGLAPNALVSTPLAIPANLPTNATFVPMRWNLAQLTPGNALVSNTVFEIEIQKFNATTYRIRNPRFIGLNAAIATTNIHVLAKASTDTGLGTEDIGAGTVWVMDFPGPIAANVKPATLGTGATTAVTPVTTYAELINVRSAQDVLTIAFDNIRTATVLAATFTSISTNILGPKCVSCHSTATPTAGVRYDTYQNTLATVTAGNPNGSRLYTDVIGGANAAMPPSSNKLSTAETTVINTWITNGAPNN